MSSIYGNAERLENVVPELRKVVPGLTAVVGCSSGGAIGMQSKARVVEVRDRTGRWMYTCHKVNNRRQVSSVGLVSSETRASCNRG